MNKNKKPTNLTSFTLFQLMIDFDNNIYWADIGNLSSTCGNPSTSLFHLSYQRNIISFDIFWIGGLLRLFGIDLNKNNTSKGA